MLKALSTKARMQTEKARHVGAARGERRLPDKASP